MLIIAAAFLMCAWLDPYKDEVSLGNKQLKDKNISEAKKHYKIAEQYAPSRDDLNNLEFNKAVADFASGDTRSAMDGYRNALRSEDKNVQKKAFYSLGNVYYKAGKKREAAQAYINALKLDPNYENAKKNLEYIFLYDEKKDENQQRNDNGDSSKGDQDKDKNRKNKKDQNKSGDDDRDKKLDMLQARNILESMKNSKVRQGKRDASRSLEKYW